MPRLISPSLAGGEAPEEPGSEQRNVCRDEMAGLLCSSNGLASSSAGSTHAAALRLAGLVDSKRLASRRGNATGGDRETRGETADETRCDCPGRAPEQAETCSGSLTAQRYPC
ncbi:hypothetical protein BS78_01G407700 [Paspalum vaginatum]|nr:hypothetical protein BS78_01G407700 [Paspalum vaginatum]